MNISSSTTGLQNYWFPGEANARAIFDFTSGVLSIESPGFPLVPEDSNNFGNVITLSDSVGYYIIGKYLVDAVFTTVTGSEGIFDKLVADIANCAFAPDLSDADAAQLYFIDSDGLHYGHIKRNLLQESSLDILATVSLALPPEVSSPLCILGDPTGQGNWLFYVATQNRIPKLVVSYCEAGVEILSQSFDLPKYGTPTHIDVYKNKISIIYNTCTLHYGTLIALDKLMTVTLDGTLTGLSVDCIQSAFSADGNSLFWLTKHLGSCNVNYVNLTTGAVVSSPTSGVYKALKCGPDNTLYGLSQTTLSASTLLTVVPTAAADEFSISEIFTPANGGFFPATGWGLYSE